MAAPDARPDLTDVVIRMAGVAVRRGNATLLADVDWAVELDERWVVLGPNGAGKTTLLRLAGAEMHPTVGTVDVLGERLGRVNLMELRTRIGLSSANLGLRVPGDERVADVVVSAGYGLLGRWRERYDATDTDRAAAACSTRWACTGSPSARSARSRRASASAR